MTPQALTALRASVEKWKAIVAGTGTDQRRNNCALCVAFLDDGCIDCPVFEKTNEPACFATPYINWIDHHNNIHDAYRKDDLIVHPGCAECARTAQAELDFLLGLMPEEAAS